MTQHSDSNGDEALTSSPSIPSLEPLCSVERRFVIDIQVDRQTDKQEDRQLDLLIELTDLDRNMVCRRTVFNAVSELSCRI